MDAPREPLPSLPDDAEALRALVLATLAERDAEAGERDAVANERGHHGTVVGIQSDHGKGSGLPHLLMQA